MSGHVSVLDPLGRYIHQSELVFNGSSVSLTLQNVTGEMNGTYICISDKTRDALTVIVTCKSFCKTKIVALQKIITTTVTSPVDIFPIESTERQYSVIQDIIDTKVHYWDRFSSRLLLRFISVFVLKNSLGQSLFFHFCLGGGRGGGY